MAQPRGEIRVVESWRPDINVLGHNVLQYLYEFALDRNELVPCLAVSRRWVDDTTLELKVREGVRFHNGEPFDAEAVKFNFEYQRKHNPGRGIQVYMKDVREIQVIDRYTVRMVLDQPNSLILDKLIIGPVSGWALGAPQYMERAGWQNFMRHPVGTGPYMVEEELKNPDEVVNGETYAVLVANPNYWDQDRPKILKINFVQYSPREGLQALVEGRVDLVTSLIPKDTLKAEESPHSKVIKGRDDVRFTNAFLNLISPHTLPLRDMRVRKALNYAVNKEELMRYAFKGNAMETRGILTEKSGVDLSDAEPYEWNIEKARELLKEAGYSKGLHMRVFCQEKDYLIAKFLQRFFSMLQIETEIIGVQWEWMVKHVVYPNTREDFSWDDEDWWICVDSEPSYIPEVMGGQLEFTYRFGAPFQCVSDYLIEPLNRMYREILKTQDADRRFQIYKKANDYIADQAFSVFTMATLGLYGVNEELDFVPHVSQYLYLDYSSVTDKHWSIRDKKN